MEFPSVIAKQNREQGQDHVQIDLLITGQGHEGGAHRAVLPELLPAAWPCRDNRVLRRIMLILRKSLVSEAGVRVARARAALKWGAWHDGANAPRAGKVAIK